MTISAFPTPTPSRDQSQDVFDPAVEAFLDHLPTFVSEANAVAVAMNLNSTTDTSVSSVAIGTGAKTFTVSTGKSFQPGMFLIFADSAAPTTNWIIAQVTTYATGTGALVVNSLQTAGSGTIASWVISQTSFRSMGVSAGDAVQVDQVVTAWTRAATTTLGTTLNGTLSDTSVTITAFNGVAGVTYHVRVLGAGSITYHASNLIITQGLADITTSAGDTFDVEMLTATTCRIKNYIVAVKPGEIISSEIPSGSAVSLTTATTANITSITVPKGKWKITAEVSFLGDGSTSVTQYGAGISTTSAAYPSKARFRVITPAFVSASGVGFGGPTGGLYIEVAADTLVYLVAQGTFTAGALQAFGNIYATRY